jgi:hypothetical protein
MVGYEVVESAYRRDCWWIDQKHRSLWIAGDGDRGGKVEFKLG